MTLGIIILAAGQGTRMHSARPKVLHHLAGKPLLKHVLDTAARLHPARLVVVYGHGGDQVLAALADANVIWVEQAQQLGTGHAVAQALPQLGAVERVLVLYGDVPLLRADTLQRLLAHATTNPLVLLSAQLIEPQGYGRLIRTATGVLQRIVEQADANAAERAITEINTGILVAARERLAYWISCLQPQNAQGEFYLTDVVSLAVAEGVTVATVTADDHPEIQGVNDRMQLAQLERVLQRQQAEDLMRAGVTLADPQRFDLRGTLQIGRDVSVDINVIIEGQVTLEDDVTIGAHCLLKNCHLESGVQVLAHSIIDGAHIGAGAIIGPFARIRPGTVLAERVHVGNFVEIKHTQIGIGSKVNHLTYLGNSSVGAGVNVGAGTITCNYDGENKHPTTIGDGAFIGSNTALVAPITIGAGATIGAGSVITRDAPSEQLTLTRAPQVSIESWTRPQKSALT